MNKRKILITIGLVAAFIVVAAAAFIGGRLLNGSGSPLGLLPLGGGANMASVNVQFEAAPELPTTQPDLVGSFAERQDNSIFVQEFSMDAGAQGGVVVMTGPASPSGGEGGESGVQIVGGGASGPKVEVVVSNETLIYEDTTQFDLSATGENQTIQQTVGPGSLDEMTSITMVTVWGRKVGDRVMADVILYSNPVTFGSP